MQRVVVVLFVVAIAACSSDDSTDSGADTGSSGSSSSSSSESSSESSSSSSSSSSGSSSSETGAQVCGAQGCSADMVCVQTCDGTEPYCVSLGDIVCDGMPVVTDHCTVDDCAGTLAGYELTCLCG